MRDMGSAPVAAVETKFACSRPSGAGPLAEPAFRFRTRGRGRQKTPGRMRFQLAERRHRGPEAGRHLSYVTNAVDTRCQTVDHGGMQPIGPRAVVDPPDPGPPAKTLNDVSATTMPSTSMMDPRVKSARQETRSDQTTDLLRSSVPRSNTGGRPDDGRDHSRASLALHCMCNGLLRSIPG